MLSSFSARKFPPLVPVLLFAALVGGPALADDDSLPPLQHQGDISWRTGGIGEDESHAMKAELGKHDLAITFSGVVDNHPDYLAEVNLTLSGKDGSPVLDLKSVGPFLVADLPPGKYSLSASCGASEKHQTVRIVAGKHTRIVLNWATACS